MDLVDFRKPINLVFLGVAVVSLIVTVITYIWSRHEADISYHTATIQIVDQKEAVPFSVIDSDGQRVTENVYATNVTVWNSGDLPIDVQNVRSPLTISFTTPVRLIDVKIGYTTSNNISEFRIKGDPKKNNTVTIGWRYFDPKEGFRARIIYASNNIGAVRLNGVIFGINSFNDITLLPRVMFFSFRKPVIYLIILTVLFMMSAILMISRNIIGRIANDDIRKRRRLAFFALLFMGGAVGFEICAVILVGHPPGPPF